MNSYVNSKNIGTILKPNNLPTYLSHIGLHRREGKRYESPGQWGNDERLLALHSYLEYCRDLRCHSLFSK